MTENDHKFKLQSKFQNYCYSFETFRNNSPFPVLFGKVILFGWACQILGRDRWKIWAKKEKYLIFSGFLKRICPNGQ